MNPIIQYSSYTVEIPDHLLRPFNVLATELNGTEFDPPSDVFFNPNLAAVVDACLDCVLAAIGKQYAHQSNLGSAVNQWRILSHFERIAHVITAVMAANPIDVGSTQENGDRKNVG